jgi:ParD-like antitoxin of type II bacterial toxin-antitoxin system
MSQPVKLSDSLVLDARLTSELAERSIASQIEFWAGLGRAIEPLMRLPEILALRKAGAIKPLSACLAEVGTATGTQRVANYLKSQPYPHYEADPKKSGMLLRIDEDGTQTTGRFVNRQFKPSRSQ